MNMPKTVRWGILGLGSIAKKFADDIKFVPDCKIEAVASSDMERSKNFANIYKLIVFMIIMMIFLKTEKLT